MIRHVLLFVGIVVGLLIIVNASKAQVKSPFIYGEVTTISGDKYKGVLKWGNDEAYWVETLNAIKSSNDFTKFLSKKELEALSDKEQGSSWLSLDLGLLSIWENRTSRTQHQFDTRFGDIRSVRPTSRGRAEITMKSGMTLEVNGDGNEDIGTSVSVYDFELGEVKLNWSRIEKIEFMSPTQEPKDVFGQPIIAIVNAGRKGIFKGLIQWDKDERFVHEILDGKDRNGDKKVPFKSIKNIEKGRGGVELTLKSGRTFFLTGSNDVNEENRGVVINDPEIGQITVPWRDFISMEIVEDNSLILSYDDFLPSKGLNATVITIDGEELKGLVAYDLDEAWEFEILDAKDDRVDFKIPFRNIKRILPKNDNYSMVTLKNGSDLLLGDSRDVSEDNDGLLIFPSKDGDPVYIRWSKIDEIIFD